MKDEVRDFVIWMFMPENKLFVEKSATTRVAEEYSSQSGRTVTHSFVSYNKNKWIMINDKPYEKDKLPLELFYDEDFKKFAKDKGIVIRYMNPMSNNEQ